MKYFSLILHLKPKKGCTLNSELKLQIKRRISSQQKFSNKKKTTQACHETLNSHVLVHLPVRPDEQLDVGDAEPHVLVVGPEPQHRLLLGTLVAGVEVGVAHAGQVGRQADEYVPAAVQVLEADEAAQVAVHHPARDGHQQPQRRLHSDVVHSRALARFQLGDEQPQRCENCSC